MKTKKELLCIKTKAMHKALLIGQGKLVPKMHISQDPDSKITSLRVELRQTQK